MTDLDISKKMMEGEEQAIRSQQMAEEAAFSLDKEPGTNAKTIGILIAILIGVFILFFAGSKWYLSSPTAAAVITVDDLHRENLAGKLSEDEGYMYNGYSFVKSDGLWWTEMNKFGTLLKVPLRFGPRDLLDVEVTGKLNASFNGPAEVLVAIDPLIRDKYYSLAVSELSVNLAQGFDRVPVGSCTTGDYRCENRTIINCSGSEQAKQPVVELAAGPGPKIKLDGLCITIQGEEPFALVKAVDRLLYQWYGVMQLNREMME